MSPDVDRQVVVAGRELGSFRRRECGVEARYGVEWQDESGNVVGTLYENDDGTQLRLRNGEVTEGIFSPYELTKLLEEQASQR